MIEEIWYTTKDGKKFNDREAAYKYENELIEKETAQKKYEEEKLARQTEIKNAYTLLLDLVDKFDVDYPDDDWAELLNVKNNTESVENSKETESSEDTSEPEKDEVEDNYSPFDYIFTELFDTYFGEFLENLE